MPHTAIRAVRLAKGLTLQEVADAIGATAASVSRWEREPQRVTVPVLHNLARVLDCQPSDLLACAMTGAKPQSSPQTGRSFDAATITEAAGYAAEELLAVTIMGDQMQPTLNPGDMVMVRSGQQVIDSGLYGVQRGNLASVKRIIIKAQPGRYVAKFDNPLYGPGEDVTDDDLRPVLLGRVMLIVKRV